jgi:hypothetical protein
MEYLFGGGTTMRWEYKTVKIKARGFLGFKIDEDQLDTMMNDLGREGWELASAFGPSAAYGQTTNVMMIFKRPYN